MSLEMSLKGQNHTQLRTPGLNEKLLVEFTVSDAYLLHIITLE